MSGQAPLLVVDRLVAGYEPGLPIVNGASLIVAAGEIVAVLGPNGAGKSTLIKAIAGLVPISSGSVTFAGQDVTHTPAHRLIGAGLAFTPQTENVFASLSVGDNLKLAAGICGERFALTGSLRPTTPSPILRASAPCQPDASLAVSARCLQSLVRCSSPQRH